MEFRTRGIVGLITLACAWVLAAGATAAPRHAPTHNGPAHKHAPRLPADYAAWAKVAVCESNSRWEILGAVYPDPLGITKANWAYYGRLRFGYAPRPELPTSSATRHERIVAIEIGDEILRATHSSIPDQNGCNPGGW